MNLTIFSLRSSDNSNIVSRFFSKLGGIFLPFQSYSFALFCHKIRNNGTNLDLEESSLYAFNQESDIIMT